MMIDSVKETQALYSLEVMGAKVDVLFSLDSFPLERIYDNWQERIKNSQNGVSSTLFFEENPVGRRCRTKNHTWEIALFVSRKMNWGLIIWTACIPRC